MKLYAFPGSCALAPHIALNWAGADYDLELIERSATRKPDFLKINPVGKVPVIINDAGKTIAQVNTVLLWIAENYPDASLMPDGDTTDWRMLLAQFNGDVHPAFTPYFLTFRFADDEETQKKVKSVAVEELDFQLSLLDDHMKGKDWVFGGKRSLLDAYLYVFCTWAQFVKPKSLKDYPNLAAFHAKMSQDEGVVAALKQQGLMK